MTKDYKRLWKWVDPEAYRQKMEDKYEHHPRLYIAYGSNLNIPQMQARCYTAKQVRVVNLLDYELVFTDVLTVEPLLGSKVPCGLWRVTPEDIDALDTYEGYPHLYDKVYVTINIDGVDELAFLYVLDIEYELSAPYSGYLRTCLDGYRQWGLDENVLRMAEAAAVDAERDVEKTPMECSSCNVVLPRPLMTKTRLFGWMCLDCQEVMFYGQDGNVASYGHNTIGTPRTSLLYDDLSPDWETCDPSELDWSPGGDYAYDDMGSNRQADCGGGWS